jgi:hypothetical protein
MTRLLAPDERAEALGERVGRSAAQAAQRLRSLATENLPRTGGAEVPAGGADEGPTQRAEYLVSSIETAAANYSRVIVDRFRRVFARAREEMEDVVAEAQSRRHAGHREAGRRQPAPDDEDLIAPS